MPSWYDELVQLFKDQMVGSGNLAGTCYDTAWVASIQDLDHSQKPAFPESLDWLRTHQHPDGSWGTDTIYYHDRILSTLMACLVLTEWRNKYSVDSQIETGLRSIWRNTTNMQRDPYEPVGFDLIMPSLLDRASRLGFRLPYGHFDYHRVQRQRKLAMIPPHLLYSRLVPTTYSFEFMGDQVDAKCLCEGVQEENGSIGVSPSATSYFYNQTENPKSLAYLKRLVRKTGGGIPCTAPIEVFEQAWCLYNLYLVNEMLPPEANPVCERLWSVWKAEGVGFSREYSVPDLDDTALTFAMLSRAGYKPDASVFQFYEGEDNFYCFKYERDASRSAHCHLLEALAVCPDCQDKKRMSSKVVNFLQHTQFAKSFWYDKWHASPYYTTGHAIIALWGWRPDLVSGAVEWIIQTQRPDGSWGYLSGTPEETAYSLQALVFYRRKGGKVPIEVMVNAATSLKKSLSQTNLDYPAQWIAKTLFSPTWVIHSAILGALAMVEQL